MSQRVNDSRRIMLLSYGDALFYSIMVGSGETFIVAFALEQGTSEAMAGMLSAVPIGVASLLQLWMLKLCRYAGSPRRWVVTCATLQGLSLLSLGILPAFGWFSVELMFVISAAYWLFGLSAGPPWNAWIDQLVAKDQQRRFFSHRTSLMQGATLASLLLSGLLLYNLDNLGTHGQERSASFLWLFGIAAAARCCSALFLSKHPDRSESACQLTADPLSLSELPIGKLPILLGFLMTFTMSLSVYISAPFFSPYMLNELHLNYLEYGLLLSVAFVARMIHSFAQGSWLPGVSSRLVFVIGMFMIVPLSGLWIVSSNYWYLVGLQIWSGLAWGAFELGLILFLMEQVDSSNRFSLLTWFNASSACGMLGGTLIGLWLIGTFHPKTSDYHNVFLISSICRMLPLVFLVPFVKAIHEHAVQFNIIGLRAGGRSMVRPVFIPEDDGPGGEGGHRPPPSP